MNTPARQPQEWAEGPADDPVRIIEQEARAVAECFGVAAPEEAAAALVERLLLRLGGGDIYLPKPRPPYLQIQREFDGQNIAALSKKYGFSERHVRRILRWKGGPLAEYERK